MRNIILLLSVFILVQCTSNQSYEHKIYYPKGYDENKDYPLLIFLHGAGERGEDLSLLEVHGPPMMIKNGHDFEAIVLAPQCPKDKRWEVPLLENLLESTLASNKVDLSRIYLTGLSMGGYGTWHWACSHPNRFAAIAPICGGGDPSQAMKIKNTPVWAFHGDKDEVVSPKETRDMINALYLVGSTPKITTYPYAGHDSWTKTYENMNFWKWMFSQVNKAE